MSNPSISKMIASTVVGVMCARTSTRSAPGPSPQLLAKMISAVEPCSLMMVNTSRVSANGTSLTVDRKDQLPAAPGRQVAGQCPHHRQRSLVHHVAGDRRPRLGDRLA